MDTTTISQFINAATILILAIFLGVELINKVPSLLHTPLMSGSNAVSGVTVVGAILVLGLARALPEDRAGLRLGALMLSSLALAFAAINVVGGFLVTHRMLGTFKKRDKK